MFVTIHTNRGYHIFDLKRYTLYFHNNVLHCFDGDYNEEKVISFFLDEIIGISFESVSLEEVL